MKLGALTVAVLMGCGVLAGCGSSKPDFRTAAANGDVTISSCGEGSAGTAVAQVKVTNHSSVESDYTTTVAFTANGITTQSFPGLEGGVGAGTSVVAQVTGTTRLAKGAKLTCQVASVQRKRTALQSVP